MARVTLVERLQPVDFRALYRDVPRSARGAERPSFVYCYLTPAGRPCYIGQASYHQRATHKKRASKVPADLRLVRLLRSGLTREEADAWERFYIRRFGRRRDGGLLDNVLPGGDGPRPQRRAA